jgi:ketosteroid isomerase-like protein
MADEKAGQATDADMAMIRALRTDYNEKIRSHDLDGIDGFFLPDYVVLPGASGTPRSRAETREIFGKAFADPAFVTYVRETKVVVVSTRRQRAAEVGMWRSVWREGFSERQAGGIYQAVWLPVRGSWRLINESFVTIDD